MFFSLILAALLLIIIGTPIYIALGGASFLVLALYSSISLDIGVQRVLAGVDKFSLMAIPYFIFAANIMASGGMAERIINLANLFVRKLRGGLAYTTIIASLFFGAVSGSSPATVAAVGKPLFPRLIAERYPSGFSSGLIVSAGSLGIIIPPSVTMIIYGAVTGTSIGNLFMGGIGAGVFFALILMIYVFFQSGKSHSGKVQRLSAKEQFKIFIDAGWGLGVPVIVLGGIYGGIFTPTEAAGVSVIYALFVTMFVYKEISYKQLYDIILDSSKVTAQVMIVIATASIMSWVVTTDGFVQEFSQMVVSVTTEPILILLIINFIFLIGGMFLDGSSLIVILAPILVPVGLEVGIDPILLGVLITVNCAIGMYTPPFGLNIFVGSSIMNLSVSTISREALAFVGLSIIALILLILFPQISLWLPSIMN